VEFWKYGSRLNEAPGHARPLTGGALLAAGAPESDKMPQSLGKERLCNFRVRLVYDRMRSSCCVRTQALQSESLWQLRATEMAVTH
jgi:hypothetical protein